MSIRLLGNLLRRFFAYLAQQSAQRAFNKLLAELPSLLNGRLRPEDELPKGWRLQLLRAVEPVELHPDGPRFVGGEITEAARRLGLLDE